MTYYNFRFSQSWSKCAGTFNAVNSRFCSQLLIRAALPALFLVAQAIPAQAGCVASDDGLITTCSGDISSTVEKFISGQSSVETNELIIEGLTSGSLFAYETGAINLYGEGSRGSGVDAIGAPNLVLDFNLDAAVSDFTITNITPVSDGTILTFSQGTDGATASENKGGGDRTGDTGGAGGAGGTVDVSINSAVILPSDGSDLNLGSSGGNGGNGAEAYSTEFGDGHGGTGGAGGAGGDTTVSLSDILINSSDDYDVYGNFFPHVEVTSTGGTGGTGGLAKASSYLARGGEGGEGGVGGRVVVTLTGDVTIETDNNERIGFYLSSLGGNGGLGGDSTDGAPADGGKGGTGGDGGYVSLSNDSKALDLEITITSAPAVILQSIAGDGGDGGDGSDFIGDSAGGDGGSGGSGGTIDLFTTENADISITTSGDNATGILARSYGGAGGDGGSASSFIGSGGGGDGASSGNGRGVFLTGSFGTITTSGENSDAIKAQSVGGFAGDGGSSSGIIAYGASSESAGTGGEVEIIFSNTSLSTTGDSSNGVFAQSIGGGGGSASSSSGIVSLSGSGSAGGNGGTVDLGIGDSTIQTQGEGSRAIYAQSVGGGGGDGGTARGLYSIGGSGSVGGSGGAVSVTNTSELLTAGVFAEGIVAQSIGGGGGSAASTSGIAAIGGDGGSGATAGTVIMLNAGNVTTTGAHSDAILLQSIGGGGGKGSNSLAIGAQFSLAIGGTGGSGGDGGDVTYDDSTVIDEATDQTYTLSTADDFSNALVAQSIGGGGGHGGNALSFSAGISAYDVSVALGGSGGAAGYGGDVTVGFQGAITTSGDHSIGILADSTGGTGGSAGTTISVANSAGVGAIDLSVGGTGGGGGDGGVVTVCRGSLISSTTGCFSGSSTADATAGVLTTEGEISHGIFASSVGGGGGHSGMTLSGAAISISSINLSLGGDGGTGGAGDSVFVSSTGGITTTGSNSNGILAKSIGGNGGAAYLAATGSAISASSSINMAVGGIGGDAGDSGDVLVVSTDSISTVGSSSTAIKAVSVAGSGGEGGVALAADTVSAASVSISLGGDGGEGGSAGDVGIIWTGSYITTGEDLSGGLAALSTGGSGGVGGFDFSGSAASAASVDVAVGGSGGAGGAAGAVSISGSGTIETIGDLASGMTAISTGGSGGLGGGSMSSTVISQGKATVTVGGDGGDGGAGGTATALNIGTIETGGIASNGMLVQSIGGNGGAGGYAAQGGITVSPPDDIPAGNVTITIGGSGGAGGSAGTVAAENYGSILTEDFSSAGMFAQSIGGNGGSGGSVYSGTANVLTSGTTIDIGVSLGGKGGDGGSGGTVTAISNGSIGTLGVGSSGIFAQSIGGNGGYGGNSYNILLKLQDNSDNNLTFDTTIGGAGGDGAIGGTVTVNNMDAITTVGISSTGIYAQSIGGNGGAGGSGGNVSMDASLDSLSGDDEESSDEEEGSTVNVSVTTAVGGSGGDGAVAGSVDVQNSEGATIATFGSNAAGIFAQSVGGGGGDGGSASNYSLSISGICDFNVVAATNTDCDEDDSSEEEEESSAELSFSGTFGGSGGTGGDGNTVTVENDGTVTTAGVASHGIFAQSVGGGGGYGGAAAPGFDTFTSSETLGDIDDAYGDATEDDPYEKFTNWSDFTLSIGGSGGAGGAGESVEISNYGSIATAANGSYGIYAQSVGGGGGTAGSAAGEDSHSLTIGGDGGAAGDGGYVGVSNYSGSAITTGGNGSIGIFAQSVGGGGGSSGFDFTAEDAANEVYFAFVIGGQNGSNGDGGSVDIENTNTSISTSGSNSAGIFAQSIGGGGGTILGGVDGASGTATVGGSGGSYGDGGNVTVNHTGSISTAEGVTSTYNTASFGIFAQSVGGGGGYAGSVEFGSSDKYGSDLTSMFSSTETSGDGGAVYVTASGDITTRGGASIGIFAQSVGGGGGIGGQSDAAETLDPLVYVGNGGGDGVGGYVEVVYESGSITTSGAGAHGIFAQSAGGTSSSTTDDTQVYVKVAGNVSASGGGAHGIFAQSTGDGMGAIVIEIEDGATVQGGDVTDFTEGEDGAGIFIKNGSGNTINNYGTITSVLGSDGVAINASEETTTVNNSGTITGSWYGNSISVTNAAAGIIFAGDIVDVALFNNEGTLSVGDTGTVSTTEITGDLTHSSTGSVVVTHDPGHTDASKKIDQLIVNGDSDLNGQIVVTLADDWTPAYDQQTVQFVQTSNSYSASDAYLAESAVGQYKLEEDDTGGLHLTSHINFENDTIMSAANANQAAVTKVLHQLYVSEDFHDPAFSELIEIEESDDYVATLDTLGSEFLGKNQTSNLMSAVGFKDSLLSCPEQFGSYRYFDQGQCTWMFIGGQKLSSDATSQSVGYDRYSWQLAGGGQQELQNDWFLGGGLSYETSNLNISSANATSDGQQFQGGITVKKLIGALELAGAAAIGYGTFDVTRAPVIGDTVTGTQKIKQASSQLRASHLFNMGSWYISPQAGAAVDYVYLDKYTESGSSSYALDSDATGDIYYSLQPAIDIGAEFKSDDGVLVRPKLSLGITHFLGDTSSEVTSRFVSAPSDVSDFTSVSTVDRTHFEIAAGVDVFANTDWTIRAEVTSSFSENTRSVGGQLKFALDF